MSTTDTNVALNALHAASTWLQRLDVEPDNIVVVCVAPVASIGLWPPGAPSVYVLPDVDDAAAEVAEAVALFVGAALHELAPQVSATALAACQRGGRGRLQVLLAPERGEIALRLVADGCHAVELCVLQLAQSDTPPLGTSH